MTISTKSSELKMPYLEVHWLSVSVLAITSIRSIKQLKQNKCFESFKELVQPFVVITSRQNG